MKKKISANQPVSCLHGVTFSGCCAHMTPLGFMLLCVTPLTRGGFSVLTHVGVCA